MAATTLPNGAKDLTPLGTKLRKKSTGRGGRIVVWTLAVLWTIPTLGLFVSSFRPELKIKTTGWWKFFMGDFETTTRNYADVLKNSSDGGQLSAYFWNSVKITIPAVVIPLLIASLAAYAFSWMKFKGRDWLFVGVVALMVVPLQMSLIPILRFFSEGISIGSTQVFPEFSFLQNSVVAVWVAHTIFAMPLAVFLLKNFIGSLPGELMEAARVDGAKHMTIFVRLVLPLSVPALASMAIFQFLWVWNDLLVATVFGPTKDVAPMTVKLNELAGSRGQDWQRLTAGAFVTMIVPLGVFFSLQRYFVRGLLAGSLKG